MSYSRILQGARGRKAGKGLAALRQFVNQGGVGHFRMGLEDADKLDDEAVDDLDTTVNKVKEELTENVPNEVETIVVNGEEVETSPEATDAQVDAAIDVMQMASNESYLDAYRSGGRGIPNGYEIIGHGGADIVGERVGNEQFIEQELKNATEISMMFNVRGQRQGRLAELFFRTSVLPAEAPYAKYELYAPQIVSNRKRAIDKVGAHQYTRLLDAAIDETLLNSRGTDAIPVLQSGGAATTGFFVSGYPAVTVVMDDDTFDTAPLALGKQINLINLSSRPGLVASGVLDNTDTLEASIRVSTLVASVDDAAGTGTTFIRFNVENLPSMQFIGSDNAVGDEVQFSHTGRFATVTSETTDHTGLYKPFAGLLPTYPGTVILSAGVSGNFNLNTGVGHVSSTTGNLTVVGYIPEGGTTVDTSSVTIGAIQTILNAKTPLLAGYELRARRTNMNKRHEGRLIQALPVREAYRVELSEPLMAQLPLGVSNERAQEIASQMLVGASRLRNNNLAITKLIETADAMRGQAALNAVTEVVLECEGIARHLIRPQFIYKVVDFDDGTVVSSIKSHERAADVSAAITNQIRMVSTQLWVRSNLESAYQYAADQGNLVKPRLAIGTDPVISQHLMVTGDTRLVGVRFDYELAYDVDRRIKDNIFLAFVSQEHQYLTFGQHLWVPEIVTNLQISRDGRTVRELQVQPRNRYVITLPVLGQIVCQNLEKALLNPSLPVIPVDGLVYEAPTGP